MTPHATEVPPAFDREHGLTEADWARTLALAVQPHALQRSPHQAQVALGPGATLHLQWAVLPERQIALVRLPRLHVAYRFEGTEPGQRQRFMARFDLVMQRGGG